MQASASLHILCRKLHEGENHALFQARTPLPPLSGQVSQHIIDCLRSGTHAHPRSPEWHSLRAAFIQAHPSCSACGVGHSLEVHHMLPFHLHPELELDKGNLITLCEGQNHCHLHVGHLGDWRKYNPMVVQDAKKMLFTLTGQE